MVVPTPPHEMTHQEFHKSQVGTSYKDFIGRDAVVGDTPATRHAHKVDHQYRLYHALDEGKVVPQRAIDSHNTFWKDAKQRLKDAHNTVYSSGRLIKKKYIVEAVRKWTNVLSKQSQYK